MNPQWFGDSYDIVKRFFIETLRDGGFNVKIDPMFTGDWQDDQKERFCAFLNPGPSRAAQQGREKTALFLDPNTGIRQKGSSKHITMDCIAEETEKHGIVFSFDQSFTRSKDARLQMIEKLNDMGAKGVYGFYYDSHARFLFASRCHETLEEARRKILSTGLPEHRIIGL